MMPVLRMERVGPMRIRVVRGMEGLLGGAAGAGAGSRCAAAGPSSSRGVRRRGRAPRRGEGGGPTAGQPLPRIGGGSGCFYSVGVILLRLGISTSIPLPGAHGEL